ncbi:MAG: SCP2 sterol-binding domain-containing protein [Acidimicrobiia bacterium]|nr:SCP2 sterol-binding domain-containing protein [Acidimicrobiia bacterium]
MAVKFLSEDWAAEVTTALQAHEQFIESADMSLQFVVNDAPQGEVKFYMDASGGDPVQAMGELENADVTISSSYETVSAIFSGELNTQMAFMTGKIKVNGNLAKLMTQQSALGHWASAVAALDVDY